MIFERGVFLYLIFLSYILKICRMLFNEDAIEECASDVKSEMTCKSSEDPDSGDEIPESRPDAQVHEIRCGLLTGKLHMQKFTCPGIHRRCIEFEGFIFIL